MPVQAGAPKVTFPHGHWLRGNITSFYYDNARLTKHEARQYVLGLSGNGIYVRSLHSWQRLVVAWPGTLPFLETDLYSHTIYFTNNLNRFDDLKGLLHD